MRNHQKDFLFAVHKSGSESEMEESLGKFVNACDNYGQIISTNKTEVMHQLAPIAYTPNKHPCEWSVAFSSGQVHIPQQHSLRSDNVDTIVNNKIAKSSSDFGRLRGKEWG